jgi:DNA-binding XRE family transcriptional regulator
MEHKIMASKKTTDALAIMDKEFIQGKPEMESLLEDARDAARVAQKLCQMRERAGLSQRELAKLVGTTASVICRLESADYDGHSLRLLRRIAEVLGYRVDVSFKRVPATPRTAVHA